MGLAFCSKEGWLKVQLRDDINLVDLRTYKQKIDTEVLCLNDKGSGLSIAFYRTIIERTVPHLTEN